MLQTALMAEHIWNWVRDHRRKNILKDPFPTEWEQYLGQNVSHYRRLAPQDREHLRALTQVFVAEKNWEGCGGLVLTDEMRVTIAAQACLMVLSIPHDLYRRVESILVYPSTVVTPERPLGVFEISQTPRTGHVPILGQAQARGPVILAWDSVLQTARHPESGHNVVYHEFAHMLDLFDGHADGTPPLECTEAYRRWVEVCSREFLRLRSLADSGKRTFLDRYGAVNEAEFFAVVTEQFFDRPVELNDHHPELYLVLRDFYRQNPAELEEQKSQSRGEAAK